MIFMVPLSHPMKITGASVKGPSTNPSGVVQPRSLTDALLGLLGSGAFAADHSAAATRVLWRLGEVQGCLQDHPIWVFPKIGVPQNGWFIMENPIKMDDLGVPLFLETPI